MNTTIQSSLFGLITFPAESKDEGLARRLKIADKALKAKSQAFRDAYRHFAIEFSLTHETFLIEEITAKYKLTKLPKPYSKNPKNAWKSTGVIITALIREGYLAHYTENGNKIFRWSSGGERRMAVYTRGSVA